MSLIVVAQRMWQRRDTAANWTAANPVLAAGEIGVELGAAPEDTQFKIGTGSHPWNDLPYFSGGGGGGEPVEMRATATHIQWRQVGEATWHDLVALSDITGPPGEDGEDGEDGDPGPQGPPAISVGPTPPDLTDVLWLDSTVDELKYYDGAGWKTFVVGTEGPPGPPGASSGQFLFAAGDRARPLPVGEKGLVPVTFSGTIRSMRMTLVTLDGAPGSVDVDIRKCSFGEFSAGRPGTGDSIVGGARPEIVSGFKTEDGVLAGWDTRFEDGDVFLPVVLGRSSNVTHFAIALKTEKDA